jgi:hypothetical protein
MPYRRDVLLLAAVAGVIGRTGNSTEPVLPGGYRQVWSDEFKSLSLRTGGPTDAGLQAGRGTWSAPGNWWGSDPKGVLGYAYDWLVDPAYDWPDGYHGPFAITSEGLRIRSQAPPPAIAAMLPTAHDTAPWLSGQINSWHGVRIAPPFYFECRAKMPAGVGRPWPAIWLMSGLRRHPDEHGQDYELDLHEGFGDSNKLHSAIHWNSLPDKPYLAKGVVEMPTDDLSRAFNTWGCHVTRDRQVFFFNDREVGRMETPSTAIADQPYGIILDVTAGIPWKDGGPPSDGPHDMIVRYVRLHAPNMQGLILS